MSVFFTAATAAAAWMLLGEGLSAAVAVASAFPVACGLRDRSVMRCRRFRPPRLRLTAAAASMTDGIDQPRRRKLRNPKPTTGDPDVDRAVDRIARAHQYEAQRCWGTSPDGQVRGWVADMAPERRKRFAAGELPWGAPKEADSWPSVPGVQRKQKMWKLRRPLPGSEKDDKDREENFQLAMEFFEREGVAKGAMVDVGCGDAFYARRAADSGSFTSVFAMDLSWKALRVARKEAQKGPYRPTDGFYLIHGDGMDPPFAKGQIDAMILGESIHVMKVEPALKALCQCLRPGGCMYVCGSYRKELYAYNMVVDQDRREGQLSTMFKNAGFGTAAVETPWTILLAKSYRVRAKRYA